MTLRQQHPYPVALQILFAVSFVAFFFLAEKFQNEWRAHRMWLWIWSGVQVLLGVLLVRARLRSRKRVLRCIRCSADIP